MSPASPVRTLSRGLTLLRVISHYGSASLEELHLETRISRPAILRLVQTLEAEGYVRRWMTDGRYRINATAPEIARSSHWSAIVADIVGPSLRELLKSLSWPADVAVREGNMMVLCETTRRQSPHLVNAVGTGYRVHMLQSAVGRAYLAYCSQQERSDIIKRLKTSGDQYDRIARDDKVFQQILTEVRQQGYALRAEGYHATPQPYPLEFHGAALPLIVDGNAVACISVTWITTATSPHDFIRDNLDLLRGAASKAESAIASAMAQGIKRQPGYPPNRQDTPRSARRASRATTVASDRQNRPN